MIYSLSAAMPRAMGSLAGNARAILEKIRTQERERWGMGMYFFLFLGVNALVIGIHGGSAQSASYVHVLIDN